MGWQEDPVVDSAQAQPWQSDPVVSSNWSDLPGNIIPDAKAVGTGAVNAGIRTAKGIYDFPEDAVNSAEDVLAGGNPSDTPIGQDAKTVGSGVVDAVKGIPQQLENLGSKEQWINHPVQNAMTAGSIAAPMFAPEEGLASKLGTGMENKGANMAADLAETSGKTVQKIRPETLGEDAEAGIRKAGNTPNVADVRTQLGKRMVNEGVVGGVGQDIGDRLQKVSESKDLAGQDIGSVRDEIRATNKATGVYDDVDDPIHVQANPILKEVLDTANELQGSARSGIKQMSRFWRETYNSLAKKAEENGGRLSLDDVHTEMQDVGKDMNSSPNSARFNAASDIYGHLADTQEKMVNDFSETMGRPDLKAKLLDANKRYTLYSKMEGDLKGPAASGATSGGNSPSPQRAALRGAPIRAMAYSAVQQIKPELAAKLVRGGPAMAKWGGMLEAAAKKGPQNLAMTDYVLRQTDPEYARATQ